MTNAITEVIKICDRHAERLSWAMAQLQNHLPFSELTLTQLSDIELAVLDQFATRFGKLQDLIGTKLFPAVLELTKEALIKSFDKLRMNGNLLISFVVSLSNHERNRFVQRFPKEPGELKAFIDILYRLEKIGAIPSADAWLLMREVRNSFSHDYPEDPKLQAAMLNKSFEPASQLIAIFLGIKSFIEPYLS